MTTPAAGNGMSAQWRDYAHYCMSYLTALKAKANDGLLHIHHGDADGEQIATELYEHWSQVFTSEEHRLTS